MRPLSAWIRLWRVPTAVFASATLLAACAGPPSPEDRSESSPDIAEVPVEQVPAAAGTNGVDLNSLTWEYTVIDENGREMTGEEAVRYLASKGAPEPILRAVSDGRPFPDDLPEADADDEAWKRIGIRISIKGTVPIKPKSDDREQPFRF